MEQDLFFWWKYVLAESSKMPFLTINANQDLNQMFETTRSWRLLRVKSFLQRCKGRKEKDDPPDNFQLLIQLIAIYYRRVIPLIYYQY